MASNTEETADSQPDVDDAEWLDQETVQEQQETDETVLPMSGAKVRYRKMSPQKFASLVDRYGITDMAKNEMDGLDPDADLSDAGDVDLENVDPDQLDELDEKLRVMLFFRDVIVPQIDKPERVHWADPDHLTEAGWVDISDLPEQDKIHLVAGITGQDPDQLLEQAQDRIDRFQG